MALLSQYFPINNASSSIAPSNRWVWNSPVTRTNFIHCLDRECDVVLCNLLANWMLTWQSYDYFFLVSSPIIYIYIYITTDITGSLYIYMTIHITHISYMTILIQVHTNSYKVHTSSNVPSQHKWTYTVHTSLETFIQLTGSAAAAEAVAAGQTRK
jgi:hypothetical protein